MGGSWDSHRSQVSLKSLEPLFGCVWGVEICTLSLLWPLTYVQISTPISQSRSSDFD